MMFVVFDCAVKLLPLIMKSFASGNMDMVVRQIDDENRRLLNSCQCVNTGHKLSCHSEFFPCSILPLQMILPLYLALRQVHYLKNGNAAGHERIVSSPKVFNDCGMRVLCESRSVVRYWFDLPRMPHDHAAWEKEFCSTGRPHVTNKLAMGTACAGDGLGRACGSESTELVQSDPMMSACN